MKDDKKEILAAIVFSIAYDNREGMINCITEYAGDEIENKADYLKLAKSSKNQLRITLNSIFNHYIDN